MNYVKVESSQIAAIGYEPNVGTEPGTGILGLRFTPNKKQQASGQPGSEYTYDNVPPRTHQALMAAPSIGSYFGQNIKSKPDLYPYTKVEAENPPMPFAGVGSGTQAVQEDTNGDLPSPGSALTVIDTMADDLLFTPGAITDAQLAAGRDWYLAEAKKYDISTDEKRMELKRFARPLQKLRTGIEARAKELTGATKRKIAAIDAEKRRLVQIVGGIEDEVLRPLTDWEQEEESRKNLLSGIAAELAAKSQRVYTTITELELAIAELEAFDLSTMQEYKIGAESAIAASLKVLKPELERRKVAEANEAELAKLRADAAARAEHDRLAAVATEAREEAERKAAVEMDRLVRERAEQEQRALEAEERRVAAVERAKRDQDAAVEAERKRIADMAEKEYAAMEARAADEAHRNDVHEEAIDALMNQVMIDSPAARSVVDAIAKGLIPHISINY